MMNFEHAVLRVTILLMCSLFMVAVAVGAEPLSPGITREQIEADWLRQDELRKGPAAAQGGGVTPEEDAAGAVDGVINGKWGFHTQNEDKPWWQVDLGKPVALDRIVLYNRGELAERNSRIIVLLSDDAKDFRQAYQHDGTVFYGHSDKKPLSVALDGAKARYVRLTLPGTSYFHLDEVEIYAAGGQQNIALGRPATQSSTSQWSVRHVPVPDRPKVYATRQVIRRGLKLADSLRQLGADVEEELKVLEHLQADRQGDPPADSPVLPAGETGQPASRAADEGPRAAYFQARWAVRKMAMKNPLLNFDSLLLAKRAPPAFPHMSDQYYGWWSRPGGGIYLLEGFKGDSPRLRCLTGAWPEGSFLRPDLSYDGKRVLFSYCKFYSDTYQIKNKVDKGNLPEDAFYHIYEMNVDGSGARRLTHGKYDDFSARYLPDGDVVFLSTRKGQSIQCNRASAAATRDADLPDSYVRCGGDNWRPVPVFTLHRVDGDGQNIRPISAFENFEWTPSVAADGRILYARWDYIDRFNGPFMSLWSTNPDGTNAQLVYGNFTTRPQCVFEARSVPGSPKLVFTAAAHHSNMGGSLALLDRTRGTEYERPLQRLTPEVCFPETEGWPDHYYANPWPLSEEYFLVAWSDKRLPPHTFVNDTAQNPVAASGIYLYDAFGDLELLYRDPEISSMYPIPLRPREKPPVLPENSRWDGPQEGRFLIQDVYRGLPGVERGSIKALRIVGVPPKVQPHMNNPVLGVSAEDPGKFVLGSAPVEADGSAHFRVPSGVSVFFQALDADGLAVQTMRSLTYVQPGQTLSCIGCHEHRDQAPVASGGPPLAAVRRPSKLRPGPEGSWPLRFDRLVQPVLDNLCVECHRPDAGSARVASSARVSNASSARVSDPADAPWLGRETGHNRELDRETDHNREKAARFDLTAAGSYQNLISYAEKDLHGLAFEKDRSLVGNCPARKSKLLALLTEGEGHYGVRLDPESHRRLVTWMDTYAQRLGHFSDEQEEELRRLRQRLAGMLLD